MNFFDEVLLPPHNTPESDPFLTVLNSVADDMDGGPQQQQQQQDGPQQQQQQQPPPFDDWASDDLSFNERTFIWQQNHYMTSSTSAADPRVTESGFISGTTTQPPSMSGHEEDMEGNFVGGPGSSIYNLDSMPQSGTNSSINVPPVDPEVFIPKLIESLSDPDRLVSDTVLHQMVKFSTKENFLQAILQSEQLVTLLVGVLEGTSTALCSPDDPETTQEEIEKTHERAKNAVRIMSNMSNTVDGKKVIVMSGAIKDLTTLLLCPVDRVMYLAIATLHTLLLENSSETELCERVKTQVRAAGGSQALGTLLGRSTNNDKLNCIVIDCLRILAVKNADTKRVIHEHNGPQLLVEIMLTTNYKRLLLLTSRLLKVLSVCPKNKPAIIQAGGIDAIARGLTHENTDVKLHCIWTLRNLSDAANNIRDLGTLLHTLVQLLDHPKDDLAVCSAGILFNLTCNNSPIKQALCNAQGIPALVRIVTSKGHNRELLEPAVGALKHVTKGHEKAEMAQSQLLQKCHALPILTQVLEHYMRYPNTGGGPHWPSVKAVLGLMRNLAETPANQELLRANEVLVLTKGLLSFIHQNYVIKPSQGVDGVHPEEIVNLLLDCMYYMAKDNINRNMLRDRQLIQVLGHLARPGAEISLKKSALCLYELSFDVGCASLMQQDPMLVETIKAQVNNGNQDIAKLALGVMQNMCQRREPLEQMQALSQPMMQNQHVTDMFGGPQNQFPPPPQHMQQPQQQQQRRFQGPPQYQQQQMHGMQQGGGFDMMSQHPQQQPQTGPPPNHPSFGVRPPPQGSAPYMDQSNDFLGEISDLMAGDFGFQQDFYDDSMS